MDKTILSTIPRKGNISKLFYKITPGLRSTGDSYPGDQTNADERFQQKSCSSDFQQTETTLPCLRVVESLSRLLPRQPLPGGGRHSQADSFGHKSVNTFPSPESTVMLLLEDYTHWSGLKQSRDSFYQISNFQLLMCKYVLGYSDLIFVPLMIILLDPEVRLGVGEVYRNKRAAREQAESSIF